MGAEECGGFLGFLSCVTVSESSGEPRDAHDRGTFLSTSAPSPPLAGAIGRVIWFVPASEFGGVPGSALVRGCCSFVRFRRKCLFLAFAGQLLHLGWPRPSGRIPQGLNAMFY